MITMTTTTTTTTMMMMTMTITMAMMVLILTCVSSFPLQILWRPESWCCSPSWPCNASCCCCCCCYYCCCCCCCCCPSQTPCWMPAENHPTCSSVWRHSSCTSPDWRRRTTARRDRSEAVDPPPPWPSTHQALTSWPRRLTIECWRRRRLLAIWGRRRSCRLRCLKRCSVIGRWRAVHDRWRTFDRRISDWPKRSPTWVLNSPPSDWRRSQSFS